MTAIKQADSFITRKGGHKSRRQIAKGWEFLLWWKDGSESWSPLKYMKEADRGYMGKDDYGQWNGILDTVVR